MTTTDTTTHITEDLGRLPKTMYAVKLRGTTPDGKRRTVYFTHDRKPWARRHHDQLAKLKMDVELLEGEVTWKTSEAPS